MLETLISRSKLLVCFVFMLGVCSGSEEQHNELSEEAFARFVTDRNSRLGKEFDDFLHCNKYENNKHSGCTRLEYAREFMKKMLSNLSSEFHSSWMQATVELALSDVLYGAGEDEVLISNLRKRALCRIIREYGNLSEIEKQVRIASYLRYINNVIKTGNDIFGFSGNPYYYQAFWQSSCDALQGSLEKLDQQNGEKSNVYELAINEMKCFKEENLKE